MVGWQFHACSLRPGRADPIIDPLGLIAWQRGRQLRQHLGHVVGAFFESWFESIAILDEESLLTTYAYIDLNPVAAGLARAPEASPHPLIRQLVAHFVASTT